MTLNATSATLFNLSTDFTIPEGSTSVSIILGANDFRLNNAFFNIWRKGGEKFETPTIQQ